MDDKQRLWELLGKVLELCEKIDDEDINEELMDLQEEAQIVRERLK